MGYEGDVFTWTNKGKNCPIIMKHLDRFLCNAPFDDLFARKKVGHLNWYPSYHRPICLDLDKVVKDSPNMAPAKSFKFEDCGLWILSAKQLWKVVGFQIARMSIVWTHW